MVLILPVDMTATVSLLAPTGDREGTSHPTGGRNTRTVPTGITECELSIAPLTGAVAGLTLSTVATSASPSSRLHPFDYPLMERELDTALGPSLSRGDLHRLYYVFANTVA